MTMTKMRTTMLIRSPLEPRLVVAPCPEAVERRVVDALGDQRTPAESKRSLAANMAKAHMARRQILRCLLLFPTRLRPRHLSRLVYAATAARRDISYPGVLIHPSMAMSMGALSATPKSTRPTAPNQLTRSPPEPGSSDGLSTVVPTDPP